MDDLVRRALVRIWGDTDPVGVGFLVGEGLLLTCAHVVASVQGVAVVRLGVTVEVDFPLTQDGGRRQATVVHIGAEDIAGLRLTDTPEGCKAVSVVADDDLRAHRVRLFGCPRGRPGGVWAEGLIRGHGAGGQLQIDDERSTGLAVEPGFSGGPVIDVDRGAVVGMIVRSENNTARRTSYALSGAAVHAAWPELSAAPGPGSPFRRLEPFEEVHQDLFFGREEATATALARLRERGLLAVLGPSGSGKSSLVLAGLVPRLRDGETAVAVVRPAAGRTPWSALASALLSEFGPDTVARQLGTEAAVPLLSRLAEALPGDGEDVVRHLLHAASPRRLVLVVDQVDEALANDEPATLALIASLVALVDPHPGHHPSVRVVLTLGPAALAILFAHPAVGQQLEHTTWTIPPPRPDDLRALVERPLASAGMPSYQQGLVDLLLTDLGREPHPLPLAEFTLSELWERKRAGYLLLETYRELGGVGGAMATFGEERWPAFGEERDVFRALCQLISPLPGQRFVRRVVEVDDLGDDAPLVRSLASTRLVTLSGGEGTPQTAELAHEALLHAWPRLREHFEERRELRAWQDRLDGHLRGRNRRPDPLRGQALRTAIRNRHRYTAANLTPRQRSLITASVFASARRWLLRAAATFLVVLLTVSLVTTVADGKLAKRDQRSATLAHTLLQADATDRSLHALLTDIGAFRTYDDEQTRKRLQDWYRGLRSTEAIVPLKGFSSAPQSEESRVSPDGSAVVVQGDTAAVWDVTGRHAVHTATMIGERPWQKHQGIQAWSTLQPNHTVWLGTDRLAYTTSPLFYGMADSLVLIADAHTGHTLRSLDLNDQISDLLADPTGRWLLCQTYKGLLLYDLAAPHATPHRLVGPPLGTLGTFVSGTAFLGVTAAGTAVLRTPTDPLLELSPTGVRPYDPPPADRPRLGGVGRFVDCVPAGNAIRFRLRDLTGGAILAVHDVPERYIGNDRYTPSCTPGSFLFTADARDIANRDAYDQDVVHIGPRGSGQAGMLSVAIPAGYRLAALAREPAGGYRLVVAGHDTALVVRAAPPDALDARIRELTSGRSDNALFTPDGTHLLLVRPDGGIEAWNTHTRRRTGEAAPGWTDVPKATTKEPSPAQRLGLSPDSRLLAGTSPARGLTTVWRLPDLTLAGRIPTAGLGVRFVDRTHLQIGGTAWGDGSTAVWTTDSLRPVTPRMTLTGQQGVWARPALHDVVVLYASQLGWMYFGRRGLPDGIPIPGSEVRTPGGRPLSTAFDASGRFVAYEGNEDHAVHVLDLTDRTEVARLPSPDGLSPLALRFGTDPRTLYVSYTTDNSLSLYLPEALVVRRWDRDRWFGLSSLLGQGSTVTVRRESPPQPWRISPDGRLESADPQAWLSRICELVTDTGVGKMLGGEDGKGFSIDTSVCR